MLFQKFLFCGYICFLPLRVFNDHSISEYRYSKLRQKKQISAVVERDKINENKIANHYLKRDEEFVLLRTFFSFMIMIYIFILIDIVPYQQLESIHPKNAHDTDTESRASQ